MCTPANDLGAFHVRFYCGTSGSPSCACQLYLTVLRLHLFWDYRNCSSISQVNHNFPDFFLTIVTFSDFSRFSSRGPRHLKLFQSVIIINLFTLNHCQRMEVASRSSEALMSSRLIRALWEQDIIIWQLTHTSQHQTQNIPFH